MGREEREIGGGEMGHWRREEEGMREELEGSEGEEKIGGR